MCLKFCRMGWTKKIKHFCFLLKKSETHFDVQSCKILLLYRYKLTQNKEEDGVKVENPTTGAGQQVEGVRGQPRQHREVLTKHRQFKWIPVVPNSSVANSYHFDTLPETSTSKRKQ